MGRRHSYSLRNVRPLMPTELPAQLPHKPYTPVRNALSNHLGDVFSERQISYFRVS